MNYIDFLKDLAPFIDKGIGDYLLNVSIALLAISSVAMLYFCYAEFKSFKKTKESNFWCNRSILLYAVLYDGNITNKRHPKTKRGKNR